MSRVAVIGGGRNCEHDISLASAASAADALDSAGHDVVRLLVDREGTWRDRENRPIGLAGAVHVLRSCDVALPLLHGRRGEDGTMAALCDLAEVPCIGSPLAAGATAMDKWLTKLAAEAMGIAVAPGRLVTRAGAASYDGPFPVVVKPNSAGSSHGVSLARDPGQYAAALETAFALDDRVLVEQLVVGREVDVAVLGRPDGSRDVAPCLEVAVEGIFDYETKYGGAAPFVIPAQLSAHERVRLETDAVTVYDALGCAGVVRIDFFLTEDGPVLNEVNTTPGFTSSSQVPQMFAAAGLSYPDLLDVMVRDAVVGLGAELSA